VRCEALAHTTFLDVLQGLDDIGTSLQHVGAIAAYEKTHAATATMYAPVDVKNYT